MPMHEDDLKMYDRIAEDFEEMGSLGTAKDYKDLIKEIRYLNRKYAMLRIETLRLREIVSYVKKLVTE